MINLGGLYLKIVTVAGVYYARLIFTILKNRGMPVAFQKRL